MTDLHDTARFGPQEHEQIVLASFICPVCLGWPAHVLVNNTWIGADATCACAVCKLQWSIALDDAQARRLRMSPPRGIWVQHRSGSA
jgi:hypothetical protein